MIARRIRAGTGLTLGAALAKADELGGSTVTPTTEVPNGKFAALRDLQGAALSVFEGEFGD